MNLRKIEPQVRKGKAMLQKHTFIAGNTNRTNAVNGMIMPAAVKAEWLIHTCLFKAGPGGYLEPDVSSHIPE